MIIKLGGEKIYEKAEYSNNWENIDSHVKS